MEPSPAPAPNLPIPAGAFSTDVRRDGAPLPAWGLVLSTYKRRDVLMLCLQAALAQTRPPAEVVIVDASTDWRETRAQVIAELAPARPGVRWHYVEAERRSLPAQRNQGIALSTAPILFMIDDDSLMYPDCAEQILRVYAADRGRQIAGVGAVEAGSAPPRAGDPATHAGLGAAGDEAGPAARRGGRAWSAGPVGPQNAVGRFRTLVRWNVAQLFDRGPESFLPYRGSWDDWPVPADVAHLDVSPARALNGFRMTFRRDVIAREGFVGWFVGYAPLEDLDASHRASRHGMLVNAHGARLCHLTHPSGRQNHFSVAAQWVMSNAVLQAVFGNDRPALARAWRRRVTRFLILEMIKDVAKGRVTLPTFRGILHGARHLRAIYAMTPGELERWYPRVQAALMGAAGAAPPAPALTRAC
jgi:glycosyltransferase involved in cell wall biosynthesis